MSSVLIDEINLTATANAIRSKLGTQSTYTPSGFASAIGSIPSGGGNKYVIEFGDVPNAPGILYNDNGSFNQLVGYTGATLEYTANEIVVMEVWDSFRVINQDTSDEIEVLPLVDNVSMFIMPEANVIIDS